MHTSRTNPHTHAYTKTFANTHTRTHALTDAPKHRHTFSLTCTLLRLCALNFQAYISVFFFVFATL